MQTLCPPTAGEVCNAAAGRRSHLGLMDAGPLPVHPSPGGPSDSEADATATDLTVTLTG